MTDQQKHLSNAIEQQKQVIAEMQALETDVAKKENLQLNFKVLLSI
jgi:hypothetical protein